MHPKLIVSKDSVSRIVGRSFNIIPGVRCEIIGPRGAILMLAALLVGCGTVPSNTPIEERRVVSEQLPQPVAETPAETEDDGDVSSPLEDRNYQLEQAERYEDIAAAGSAEQFIDASLSAAEFYIQGNDSERAEQAIQDLDPRDFSVTQYHRYEIIRAYAEYARGEFNVALSRVQALLNRISAQSASSGEDLPSPASATAPQHVQQQVDALLLASFCYQQLEQLEQALDALLQRESLLYGQARSETTRYIGQVIDSLPTAQRSALAVNANNPQLRIRLEQAVDSQTTNDTLLPNQFDQWRESDAGLERQVAEPSVWSSFSPRNIAVLLPFSSRYQRAAEAVRDGIEYQHQLNTSAFRPNVYFYDIGSDLWQVQQYYRAAVEQGADLIIGPLGKDYADTLLQSTAGSLSTPSILLGGDAPLGSNGFRLDLSPEHEAERIAERALAKGYVNAVILAPSNSSGQRASNAFNQAWLRAGGRVVKTVVYSPEQYDHSTELKLMFDLNQSQARFTRLANTLEYKPEFTPYRRQDIDFIYMIADKDSGRIVRPQINFFSANQVPVMGSSALYDGIEAVAENMDLNGTEFPAMPWELKSQDIAPYAGQLNRLFALGSDAYQLSAELNSLRSNEQQRIRGNTGTLSITPSGAIRIEPVWAVFRDGKVATDVPITPLDLEGNPLYLNNRYEVINPQGSGMNTYDESNWDPRQSRRRSGS